MIRGRKDSSCRALPWLLAGVACIAFVLALLPFRSRDAGAPATGEGGEARTDRLDGATADPAVMAEVQSMDATESRHDDSRGAWTLRGRIVRLAGRAPDSSRPVEGAAVQLSIAPPWPGEARVARPWGGFLPLATRSASDGQFEIAGIPPAVEMLLEAEEPAAGYFALRLVLPQPDGDATRDAGDIAVDPGSPVRVLVETVDHRPIVGAKVWLTHRSSMPRGLKGLDVRGNPRHFKETGPGDYRIDRVTSQPHLVRVEAPGFGSRTETLKMSQNRPHIITLLEPRHFGGRVLAPTGEPVPGARIELLGGGSANQQTVSGSDGRFVFERAPSPLESIKVEAEGYCNARSYIGEDQDAIDIRLATEAILSGTVVEARDDRPVAGARVAIVTSAGSSADHFSVTDASGRFEIRKLEGGLHSILVEHSDLLPSRSETIQAVEGARVEALVFRLERGAAMRGWIRDSATGAGIRGARVLVRQEGGDVRLRIERRVETDESGAFEARNLRLGEVVIEASAAGFSPGRIALEEVPAPPEEAAVSLERGAVIWIRVLTTSGAPVAGAQVFIRRSEMVDNTLHLPLPEGGPVRTTDEAGVARFEGLTLEAKYGVQIRHPDFVDVELDDAAAESEELVHLTELRVEQAARVRVLVADSHGHPVPYARVRSSLSGTAYGSFDAKVIAITDSDGTSVLGPFLPPQLWVYADAPGQAPSQPQEVRLVGGETAEARIVLPAGHQLEGLVSGDGAGIAGAVVEVQLLGPDVEATSGPDGSFAVDGLPAGSFRVLVSKPGWVMRPARASIPGPKLELHLDAMATLRGQVEAPGGIDLRSTRINLRVESSEFREAGNDSVQVDAAGRFELHVAPGRHLVDVELLGCASKRVRVDLAPGQTRDWIIRLEPPGRMDGVAVETATGEPVRYREVGLVREADHAGAEFERRERTSGAGEFSFLGLPSGVYRLHLLGGSSAVTGRLDGILLRPGSTVQARIEARQSQGIRGVLMDGRNALQGAAVIARHIGGGEELTVATTAGGQFEVPDLPPGEYEIIARHDGRASLPVKETVAPGEFVNVKLDLAKVLVEGRMLRAGLPVARDGVKVELAFAEGTAYGTETDESGAYKISLESTGELEAILLDGEIVLHRFSVTIPSDAVQFHLDFEVGAE